MEYFNYYTEDEKYKFIKNRLKCNFNNYYIELNNESEKKEVESIVKDLNEKLSLVGSAGRVNGLFFSASISSIWLPPFVSKITVTYSFSIC